LFRRRNKNHTSAIKIAAPTTPPTTPPAIAPVSFDEAGFVSVVLVGVGDAVVEVDDVELGVGVALSQ
jgi:hypothetical protein